jgi:hypothetical protein
MADMQAGIGPFLGVFLLAHGWQSGLIGSVMTIGGVAGMLMTAPAGALVVKSLPRPHHVVLAEIGHQGGVRLIPRPEHAGLAHIDELDG